MRNCGWIFVLAALLLSAPAQASPPVGSICWMDDGSPVADAMNFLVASTCGGGGASRRVPATEVASYVLAEDGEVSALAGLTSAADKCLSWSGAGTAANFNCTSYGRSLLDVANEAAFKALVNLEAGTDFYSVAAADAAFQPLDAELTLLGGLAETNGNIIFASGGAWSSQAPLGSILEDTTTNGETALAPTSNAVFDGLAGKQAADADLTIYAGITPSANVQSFLGAADYSAMRALLDLEAGTDFHAYDATLAALAGYSTNGLLVQTAADTFAGRTITGTANEITVSNGDGGAGNPTLSLPAALTFTGKTVTGGTFAGAAHTGANTFAAGTGAGTYQASGLIDAEFTAVGNVTTGEDDLMSYVLPADSLSAAGKCVRVTALGDSANNANAKTVRAYINSTSIFNNGILANNLVNDWFAEVVICSTGTDAQKIIYSFERDSATSTDVIIRGSATATENDGAAVTIKFTGEATGTDDIQQEFMLTEMMN